LALRSISLRCANVGGRDAEAAAEFPVERRQISEADVVGDLGRVARRPDRMRTEIEADRDDFRGVSATDVTRFPAAEILL
jgi:hypothetical protein